MHLKAQQELVGGNNAHLDIDNTIAPERGRTKERTICTNASQTIYARCSEDKNKGKAYTIPNEGERGDKDQRGIKEKRSKVVIILFFTRARGPREITFF